MINEAQTYELERLRESNVKLTIALEIAVTTIERLVTKHGPFTSADGTLALVKTALQNNKS
jgi:hypothetical protein